MKGRGKLGSNGERRRERGRKEAGRRRRGEDKME